MEHNESLNAPSVYLSSAKKLLLFFSMAVLWLLVGCKKDILPGTIEGEHSSTSVSKKEKTPVVFVQAGTSIQTAINAAASGTLIKIAPGTYTESLQINKPGITLAGDGNVVLQNPGSEPFGILVTDAADGFALRNITIRDFHERGVKMTGVNGFLFSHLTVFNNGKFGLFSEYCSNGIIEHCEGTGHAETGIFVGQSTDVSITQNRMYKNVIGLEVENSSFIIVDKNHTYNNAVGILCLLVPGRTVTQSSNITLTKNHVRENNPPNFSAPPEQESILPSGTGILVLGTDKTLVQGNQVAGNNFTGIAVISTNIFGLFGFPIVGIEPNPDDARIIGNHLKNNGYNPPSSLPFSIPGVDLLWLPELGPGTNNCWSKNLFTTSYPSPLPACQ